MSIGISKLFEEAESLADQRRLTLALEKWDLARQMTRIPDRHAWATFNLGVLHWVRFGNGEAARREFLAAAAELDAHGYGQHPQFRLMHAAAIENAMLCALSFDELEALAVRLRALVPDMPILAGLLPRVREARERGEPWSHMLLVIANPYYNRNDPKLDAGRYGEAMSTYHILLVHRREVRLAREDWRLAIYEYCALAMRMASDCMRVRGGDSDPHSPEEFLSILTDALPLVDEYLSEQSGDDDMTKVRADMESMVDAARQRWALASRNRPPSPTGCGSTVIVLATVLVGLVLWILAP